MFLLYYELPTESFLYQIRGGTRYDRGLALHLAHIIIALASIPGALETRTPPMELPVAAYNQGTGQSVLNADYS